MTVGRGSSEPHPLLLECVISCTFSQDSEIISSPCEYSHPTLICFYRRLLILLIPFSILQKMLKAEQNKDSRSEEEETDLIEFSLFVAEMFYRVRIGYDQVQYTIQHF